jgi:hypothetical protein
VLEPDSPAAEQLQLYIADARARGAAQAPLKKR